MRLSEEHTKLYKAIDEILWNDWDPIGINDTAPRDEYQGYTPTVFSLKIHGADKETIAQKLYEFETDRIGLLGDLDACLQIAHKIMELK